jgi:hypothetical protein
MFTKIKNEITQEKHTFRDTKQNSSQDFKTNRNILNKTDHYDSHKELGKSISKFGYEDILKERNFYKR